jgi:hypothetical protein
MIEIVSLQQFKEYRSYDGYFIVTDTTGKKIHVTRCPTIDASTFKEKVIENKKNGNYYYFSDLIEAQEKFKVKKCNECRRYM